MKKVFLYAAAACMVLMTACNNNDDEVFTVTFEGASLVSSTGGLPNTYSNILWGKEKATSDGAGSKTFTGELYKESGASFNTYYTDYGGYYDTWGGWAISSNNDKTNSGYTTQFDVYASTANKFAVAYYMGYMGGGSDVPVITFDAAVTPESLYIANNVYTQKYMETTFAGTSLYYNVVITGYAGTVKTNSVTVELTSCTDWTKVDLSVLGTVDKITFSPDSNDSGSYGLNVPTYFCIDNLRYSL